MSLDSRFRPVLFAISGLALGFALMLGCGGGGGGGGGGTSGGAVITASYDYYGATSTTAPSLSPGDQVILTASETVDNTTSALAPYNFNVQGGATIGTVTAAGVFTAGVGISSGNPYTITANSSAGPVTWTFTGAAALTQPVIVGIVEASASQAGVAGATITAYDANGNTVGTAASGASGLFTMPVTTAATRFGVSIGGVDQSSTTFYAEFQYGASDYATSSPACLPALPALNTGNHHYGLPNAIVLQTNVYNGESYPPPPPPGCLP